MTPSERKRAVEVMARAAWDEDVTPDVENGGKLSWSKAPVWRKMPYVGLSSAALTALLRIADVKMKDQADDR